MTESVLLVGASSPLGRAVASELITSGHRVTRTSRTGGEFDLLDISDASQNRQVLERVAPTAIVYLARPHLDAVSNVPHAIDGAVESLRQFALACAELGVGRLIFASSAAVYGTATRAPHREVEAVKATSPYAILKSRSESVLRDVSESSSLATLAFRIFNLYGGGFSQSLVNRLAIGDGSVPSVHRTEEFVRDYVHVSDVARAFGIAVSEPVFDSPVLNLGTGVGTSNETLLRLCPDSAYTDSTESDVASHSVADPSLIRSLWGFETQVTLEIALSQPDKYLRKPFIDPPTG